jgi:hypothetical protein
MEKSNYPLQRKLFDKISSSFSSRPAAIAHYQKKYKLSRSKAYAHFNGERAIEGDGLLQLMSDYSLHDLDIWPEGWPETHFLATVLALQPNLDAYMRVLKADLAKMQQSAGAHLYHAGNDVPILLLKTRRRLAGFLLYFHFNYEQTESRFRHIKFGEPFLQYPGIGAWLDNCRAALASYHEIPGTEYWTPRMLDSLLARMKVVRDLHDFCDPEEYARLLGEVRILIRDLEQLAERGAKLSGAPLKVFNHHGLLSNNLMIGQSASDHFIYLNFGLTGLHRYRQPDMVQAYLNRIQRIGAVLPELANVKNRREFFSALHGTVDEWEGA